MRDKVFTRMDREGTALVIAFVASVQPGGSFCTFAGIINNKDRELISNHELH